MSSWSVRIAIFFYLIPLITIADNSKNSEFKNIINPKNLPQFYDQLFSPFIPLIKEQKLVLPLAENEDRDFELSEIDNEIASSNLEFSDLDENGNIITTKDYKYGLPFGTTADINKEANPNIKAVKILWNTNFALNLSKDLLYNIYFNWYGSQAVFKSAEAKLYRRNYDPTQESKEKELPYLFEILNFISPAAIADYLIFSKKYLKQTIDEFYTFSNLSKKLRIIPDTLAGDRLLSCDLSFDELNVFTQNIKKVELRTIEEKVLLLPFLRNNILDLSFTNISSEINPDIDLNQPKTGLPKAKEEDKSKGKYLGVVGDNLLEEAQKSFVVFNFQDLKYGQSSPWATTNIVYLPRKVWIIEILPKDPFYQYGKQLIFVDQKTFLPFYKIVENKIGEQSKIIIASWAKALSADKKTSFFFNIFTTAFDPSKQTACSINTSSVFTFQGKENSYLKDLLEKSNPESYKKEEKKKKASDLKK